MITVEYSVGRYSDVGGVVIYGTGSGLNITPTEGLALNFSYSLQERTYYEGTFNLTRHAGAYFREQGKADESLGNFGRIINTASDSGLYGNVGQSNYGAAKSGIATFSVIVSRELAKYATVNCVVPSARTRMTTDLTPRMAGYMEAKTKDGFDMEHRIWN